MFFVVKKKVMVEKERLWKENVDGLEKEFRGMILEVNQKYKTARDSVGEKFGEVEELKGALKVAFGRSKDLEEMVNEMNDALMIAKKEIENLRGAEESYRNNDGKEVFELRQRDKKNSNDLKKSLAVLAELREDLGAKELEVREQKRVVSEKSRECYDLRLSLEEQQDVVRRIEDKFKVYEEKNIDEFENLRNRCDELLDEVKVKNKILDERNRECETVKMSLGKKYFYPKISKQKWGM